MKKLAISAILIILIIAPLTAQSDQQGMKYQAVARNLSGEVMSNKEVSLQVQLQGNTQSNKIYYSETHEVTTNQFGLFSLVIGKGKASRGAFKEIPWSSEDIWMEIAMKDGKKSNYTTISNSKLLAVPYAFHANTASKLSNNKSNNEHDVAGVPSQVWSLKGNNKSDPETDKLGTTDSTDLVLVTNDLERLRIEADGKIKMDGSLDIGEDLSVGRNVYLNYRSNIQIDDYITPRGETFNNGNFTVGSTDFNSNTYLNGQTLITFLEPGLESDFNTYPLRIFGSKTGIAIKLNNDEPSPEDNFVTFFNNQNQAIGRIEGNANVVSDAISIIDAILKDQYQVSLSNGESYNLNSQSDKDYLKETYFKNDTAIDFGKAYAQALWHGFMTGVKLGLAIPTVGVEGDFDDVVDHLKDCLKALVEAEKIIITGDQQGVSYSSGGADYAEWLKKAYPDEHITFGEVVGIKGGLISKTFTDADQFMAITSNPIIIGAMPQKDKEYAYEKVALMGQVPILVSGTVNMGDYILPSGNGDGTAKAVKPEIMKAGDFSKIIGVAWSSSNDKNYFNYINTAVGFNANQMGVIVNNMQSVINKMQDEIAKLNPNYKPVYFLAKENNINNSMESLLGDCYSDCASENWGLDTFKCYFKCYLANGDIDGISAENNIVLDLLEKLKDQTVKPRMENLKTSLNDIFPDVSNFEALDKIPEIKNIILDVMDGPPFSKPNDISNIIDKLKSRIVRINYFIE